MQGCSGGQADGGGGGRDGRSTAEETETLPPETREEGEAQVATPTAGATALIRTSKGDVEVEFYPEDAPETVKSFLKLAEDGFYDGIRFHRVEPGFVVQGGDPLTKGLSAAEVRAVIERQRTRTMRPQDPALGTGGPGFNVRAEFNSRKHVTGTLAMARSESPDSAGSQFYICLGPQPFLDGNYTVFGQVTSGMDVVESIEIGDSIGTIDVRE
ncbi:MAG: peptidylprolyl isomerase [Coriobacteriia bacterium]|nr:peptidylprolyl isomerase [Coriobacteriia bacterium]